MKSKVVSVQVSGAIIRLKNYNKDSKINNLVLFLNECDGKLSNTKELRKSTEDKNGWWQNYFKKTTSQHLMMPVLWS